MMRGLLILAFYVLGTAYLTYEGLTDPEHQHIERIEGVVNGLKAFANAVVTWHGLQIVNATSARVKVGAAARALRWASAGRESRASKAGGKEMV